MDEKPFNNNLCNISQNGIKSKKIVLKYPQYISNKELMKCQIKIANELYEIKKENFYLQNSSIFNEVKRKSLDKLFKDMEQLNNSKNNNKKDNSNLKFDSPIKKPLIKKLKNKKMLLSTNNVRKILESKTKFIPSKLLDFIHPYEYLFNNKNIQSRNKNKQITLQLNNINSNSVNNIKILTLNNKTTKKIKTNNIIISPIKTNNENNKNTLSRNFITDISSPKSFITCLPLST